MSTEQGSDHVGLHSIVYYTCVALFFAMEDSSTLHDSFKTAAVALTTLYKQAQSNSQVVFADGYLAALRDIATFCQQHPHIDTDGLLAFLVSRQQDMISSRTTANVEALEHSANLKRKWPDSLFTVEPEETMSPSRPKRSKDHHLH
jgi:hypothetical protein